MGNELQTIITNSGLQGNKANDILIDFQSYFDIAAEWEAKAKTIIVTDCSQKQEMMLARDGRLFLKEKRIAIEKKRKELKEDALREGQAIDGIAKVLKGLIEPIEIYLEEQEKFVEIQQEAARRKAKLEADQKAEAELLEAERIAAEEQKRIREENEKLRKENEARRKEQEEREKAFQKERDDNAAKLRAEEAKAREATRKNQEAQARIKREEEIARKKIEEAEAIAAEDRRKFEEEIAFHETALAEANSVIEEQKQVIAIAQITCPACGHHFDPDDGKF